MMNVRIDGIKTIQPIYDGISSPTSGFIPFSVFDKVAYNAHSAQIFAYHPPTPPNANLEYGLKRVLSEYREFAGRLGEDDKGDAFILLNDKGAKLVEASVDGRLDQVMPMQPSPVLRSLYPSLKGAVEIVLVQLTRFACGSLVVGFTLHHSVADGNSTFNFLVAWGKASRGLDISPLPLHDRTIFKPRNPPVFEFEHREVQFIRKLVRDWPNSENFEHDIIVHKVHFTVDFISKIKAMASNNNKPYSTYESLVAHLWRTITKARGLSGSESTHVIVSVNGRMKMKPKIPNEYFGNVLLWAFPGGKIDDILQQPLAFAAQQVHDGIAKLDSNYFQSFIDLATHKLKKEDNSPTTNLSGKCHSCPNLEVNSWIRFPIYDVDFGGGRPFLFLPSYFPVEGMIYLLPSSTADGSIDAYVFLLQSHLSEFKQSVYLLEEARRSSL